MTDYIKRDDALDICACDLRKPDHKISYHGAMVEMAFRIGAIPAADVAPVRHGKWIDVDFAPFESRYATCSACKNRQTLDSRFMNYCPHCGAKMDGKEKRCSPCKPTQPECGNCEYSKKNGGEDE